MSAATAENARSPGLDLIRAIAIAWVTIYHAMTFGLVPHADRWVVGFGWIGVDLFFVLSGFLIAGQLLKPWVDGDRPRYRRFFVRRLFRTLPAYTVVLAIYFLVPGAREREAIQPLWQFATFTQNLFFDPSTPKSFSHVWSLCVEEQFYLVFPALIALLATRPSMRTTMCLFGALVIFGMAIRGALWLSHVAETPFDVRADPDGRAYMASIYYPTWSRLDGLLAGVAAAAVRLFRPRWWHRWTARGDRLFVCGAVGIGCSIALFQDQIAGFVPTVFGYPLLASSIALLVVAASERTSSIGRIAIPGAATLAAGAYSIYLTQKFAFHLVAAEVVPTFGATGVARLAIALMIAALLGALLHRLVERPFLRLRDRLDRRALDARTPPLAASGR